MRVRTKKKLRKTTRFFYLGISIVLAVISIASLCNAFFSENAESINEEIYRYDMNYNLNYDVYLKENKFIENEKLQMGQVYVTDLIDYLDLYVQFQYIGSERSNISYKYNIKGVLEGIYSKERYRTESMGKRVYIT